MPKTHANSQYAPFGMILSGRSWQAGSGYRYTFNGKEFDNETKIQDYGMRIYMPTLGRFLSIDPLTNDYPELTPYQFASNRPIDGIDLDGLEYTSAADWAQMNLVNKGYKWRDGVAYGPSIYRAENWKQKILAYTGRKTLALFCSETNAISYYQANTKVADYLQKAGMGAGWYDQYQFFKNSTSEYHYLLSPTQSASSAKGDLVFLQARNVSGHNHACMLTSTPITSLVNGKTQLSMTTYSTNAVSGTDAYHNSTNNPDFNTFGICTYLFEQNEEGWLLISKTTTYADGSEGATYPMKDQQLYLKGFGRVDEAKIDPPVPKQAYPEQAPQGKAVSQCQD